MKVGRPLSEILEGEIQRGISADFNDAFIVTEETRSQEQIEPDVCLPVVTGRNAARYSLSWTSDYVLYLTRDDDIDQYPRARTHLQSFQNHITCNEVKSGRHPWYALHRPRDRRLFTPPKLVGLTTTDRLSLALDINGYFAMDALYVFHIRNDVSAMFLIALLNSKLLTFIYRYLAQEEGRVLPQVKAENLYPLPIRRVVRSATLDDRERLLEKGKETYEGFLSSGDKEYILRFVKQELDRKPQRDDGLHDLIAFLGERMMNMNAGKHEEVQGFLSWLERSIGTKVDNLNNKTRIRAYHENDLQALLSILRTNQRRLGAGVNVSGRNFQEELEREFTASMQKLEPLKANIEATDNLIDEIVFRLYGLTDEEISLVKGQSDPESAG